MRIDSYDDDRIDIYARLTEHQLRSRLDVERAVMIGESRLVLQSALDQDIEPLSLLIDERHLDSMQDTLARLAQDTPVYVASREVMSQITGFQVTRGYLCALPRPRPRPLAKVIESARTIAVLEGIVDVSNVGALFRSAAALGVDGVVLAPGCADPYTRRALRVSMGSVLRIPWARADEDWPQSAVEALNSKGFCCIALALDPTARKLDDPRLRTHERIALFLGSEGFGLQSKTVTLCDERAIIPMSHGVDSLNVATAAAIAFWELARR